MTIPPWLVGVLEWVVGLLLQQLKADQVKNEIAALFLAIDAVVQSAEGRVQGPFKGLADEVALAFHQAVLAIVAALQNPAEKKDA